MKRILLLVISVISAQFSMAQWAAMSNGFNGTVNSLCVFQGSLYAGGSFTMSGTTAVNGIAKWNGSTWQAVSGGVTVATPGNPVPVVYAMIVHNNELYVGGGFNQAGTVTSVNNIAKWNGTTWASVDSGLSQSNPQYVRCFAIHNNVLYAGGSFGASGVTPVSKVGKLEGNSWSQAGTSAPPHCGAVVYALASYNSKLYVAGGGSAPNMDFLNGNVWTTLGAGGPDFQVFSLAVGPYGGISSLWIGGQFQQPSYRLCTYQDGFGFGTSGANNNFSGGAADKINAIYATNSVIYVGGVFTSNAGFAHPATNLAKKSPTAPWDSASGNFNGGINAITVYNGHIIVGGSFTLSGSLTVNNVAMKNNSVGIDEETENIIVNTVYPNPVIKEALLKVQTKSAMDQPELKMYDVTGKEITGHSSHAVFDRSNNAIEFRIVRGDILAGIYYYSLMDGSRRIAAGQIIVE